MKKSTYLIISLAAIMMSACSNGDEPGGKDKGVERPPLTVTESRATTDLNEFSLDFISAVADETADDKNFVVSPLSMSMFLSMTANCGDADAICKALHCSDLDALNSLSAKYLKWLPNVGKGVKINIANALWYSDRYTVNPEFATAAKDVFSCDIFARDFYNPALKDEINGWADKNTNGMIKHLVNENPNTHLLANALYFKGAWDEPFDKKNTKKASFHGLDGITTIDMMRNSITTSYFDTDEAQVVSLSFAKGFEAIILMPKESQDINTFIKEKLAEHWEYMSSAFYRCYVDLSLPKFELAPEKIDMNEILKSLLGADGIKVNLLTEGKGQEELKVNQIATVRFDEQGAEAAAVTWGEDVMSPGPTHESATMTVDRPFLFFINEYSTGLCLFAGKVVKL